MLIRGRECTELQLANSQTPVRTAELECVCPDKVRWVCAGLRQVGGLRRVRSVPARGPVRARVVEFGTDRALTVLVGRLFHIIGPPTSKLLAPILECLRGTLKMSVRPPVGHRSNYVERCRQSQLCLVLFYLLLA